MNCEIPNICQEVIYASYEVGESKSVSNHVKLTCKTKDGISTFVSWQFNGWGILGLNRVGSDNTRIDFKPGNSEKLVCK